MKTFIVSISTKTCVIAVMLLAASITTRAADITWDANGGTAANPQDGAAQWSTAANNTNWWDGASNVRFFNGDNVTFGAGNGAAGVVNPQSAISVGNIIFNAPASGIYSIKPGSSGNKITVSGTITVATGVTGSIEMSMAGAGFTKAGDGTLTLRGTSTGHVNTYTGTITLNAGIMELFKTSGTDGSVTGALDINGGTARYMAINQIANTSTVTVNGGTLDLQTFNDTIGSLVVVTGSVVGTSGILTAGTFDLRNGTVSGRLGGAGTLTKTTADTVTLSGANTFTGDTRITTGTLLLDNTNALGGSTVNMDVSDTGSLSFGVLTEARFGGLKGSRNLVVENTTPAAVALSVGNNNQTTIYSGNLTGSGTLNKIGNGALLIEGTVGLSAVSVSAGTLGGIGIITGPVIVHAGGTLSAGESIGNLTISSSVTLETGSFTAVELDQSAGTNDLIRGMSSIAFAGTLNVTNLNGVLTSNDVFKIFSATTYSGAFDAIVPATPGVDLTWDTNTLNIDGKLRIAGAGAPPPPPSGQPRVNSIQRSGADLIFSGTNGTANGPYNILTNGDPTVGVGSWGLLMTGSFDGSGNFSFTNTISGPRLFYVIQQVIP